MKNKYLPETRQFIKNRIVELRTAAGLKQEYMAKKIGKKKRTYISIEYGKSLPNVFTLKKICEVFGISMDKFMEGAPSV